MKNPAHAEVWLVSLDPVRGVEQGSDRQGNNRPCLIVSVDDFNFSAADLVVILPITSTKKEMEWWVQIEPPEGGLNRTSFIMCEHPRAVDYQERFSKKLGIVSPETMLRVKERLRYLLEL
jgi:mRNA interferase MazF